MNAESNKQSGFQLTDAKIIDNGGTFGVVYQAKVKETGEIVAVKKVFQDRRYKNRELQIMQELDHCNVIKLKHFFYTTDKKNETYLHAVMDLVPQNLYRSLTDYTKKKLAYPNILIKLYTYQMFRGLAYVHGKGVCHRDIKPQNILVNPETFVLKICDFGSAKKLVKGEPNIAYICSRYYRAPELIFGATDYTQAIDVWSMGCCVAQLMLGKTLFPGESSIDQLVEIIKVLGSPSKEQIYDMNPKSDEFKLPNVKAKAWSKVFGSKVDPLAVDLISKIMVYSPQKRLKPLEILLHPYFNDIKVPNCKINGKPIPDLFNFYPEELATCPGLEDKLIPGWYTGKKM